MSQYLLLTSFLLICHLTTTGQAGRTALSLAIKDNDLQGKCDLELRGHHYNLCPLLDKTLLVNGRAGGLVEDADRGEGPSSGKRFYEVALGGLSQWSQADILSKSTNSHCDENTLVCMLDVPYAEGLAIEIRSELVRRPAHAIPIATKMEKDRKRWALTPEASLELEEDERGQDKWPRLQLRLHGGSRERKPQSAEIVFSCAESESLVFTGEENNTHHFIWSTSYGCPIQLPDKNTKPSFLIAQEEGNNDTVENPDTPPDDEEKQGLLPSDNGRMRRWIAIIVLISLACLALGFILVSSTRARHLTGEKLRVVFYAMTPLLAQAAVKLQPMLVSVTRFTSKSVGRLSSRFRQGDSQLVKWAQEDMSLMDSEDVMVNGEGAYDRDWDTGGADEYIPLTLSPKFGRSRQVRSYGTTPEVETFAERGVMTGLGKYLHK